MVTQRSTICVVPECDDQQTPMTDYCPRHQTWKPRGDEAYEQWKRHVDASLVTANDVLKRLLGSWCNTPMDFLPGNMHRLLIEIAWDRKEAGTLDAPATERSNCSSSRP